MTLKTCTKCNIEQPITDFYYHRNRKVYISSCKKCNSRICNEYQKKSYRKTDNFVFYQRAYEIIRRCKPKNIPCAENLRDLLADLWKSQQQKCYYTGLQMSFTGYHTDPMAMTVDRIVPEKGYINGNIVLAASIINRMKQDLGYDDLLVYCELILQNKESVSKKSVCQDII